MTDDTEDKVVIPARVTQRVRVDIDKPKAEKLRRVAAAKGRTQSELVEMFIDSIDEDA